MRNLHPATRVALVALAIFVIVLLWLLRWVLDDPTDQPATGGSAPTVAAATA